MPSPNNMDSRSQCMDFWHDIDRVCDDRPVSTLVLNQTNCPTKICAGDEKREGGRLVSDWWLRE